VSAAIEAIHVGRLVAVGLARHTSSTWAVFLTWARPISAAFLDLAGHDQLLEAARADDVRALADEDRPLSSAG